MYYEIGFINGHTMRYDVARIKADSPQAAKSKLYEGYGNFDHQIAYCNPVEMTRSEENVMFCYDEDTNEFDWDLYQYLCDIDEYWGIEG